MLITIYTAVTGITAQLGISLPHTKLIMNTYEYITAFNYLGLIGLIRDMYLLGLDTAAIIIATSQCRIGAMSSCFIIVDSYQRADKLILMENLLH